MMLKIEKSSLSGIFIAPPSKSYAHRALILSAFSGGECKISNIEYSDDILATISCLENIGIKIIRDKNSCIVYGIKDTDSLKGKEVLFNCNDSASTLRFFKIIAEVLGINAKFTGSESLLSRPTIEIKFKEDFKIKLPGDISSQFVTGLLLAGAIGKKDFSIDVMHPIVSKPYIDITIDMLKMYGIDVIEKVNDTDYINYKLDTKLGLKAIDYTIEGDYSGSANFEAMNNYSDIIVNGLKEDSLQGDKIYKKYFKEIEKGFSELDIKNCIDLAPILLVYATFYKGVKLINTNRLKIKESDRATAMKEELAKFGINVIVNDNDIVIKNPKLTKPTVIINSHNDHRICMALTVLGLKVGDTMIERTESVNKSFNSFFDKVKSLGGNINEI